MANYDFLHGKDSMIRNFRTPKGTELPLLNLRGKEYLETKFRLVWFREEMPLARIETDIIHYEPTGSVVKATIRDDKGNILATAHKTEDPQGFQDHLEKAETGAIGRALAMCGYGTQFVGDDLAEGGPADSPRSVAIPAPIAGKVPAPKPPTQPVQPAAAQAPTASQDWPGEEHAPLPSCEDHAQVEPPFDEPYQSPGDFKITFGKFKKHGTLATAVEVEGLPEIQNYLNWVEKKAQDENKPISASARELKINLDRYTERLHSKAKGRMP